MSGGTLTAVLAAFVIYLLLMIIIGALYMKKTNNSEDYFLGGRGLSGWIAALSAQASDMSGWLLMGLPGTIYALGTGQSWIAIGLLLGTIFNWVCISSRLRRYTITANNSLTLPEFFENRFRDKKRILLLISSIVIVIFFLVYTASALAAGGKLFNSVFGLDYHIALAIGAAVILIYTFMGGFMAVCTTDFIQGTLMLIGLLVVPIVAYVLMDGNIISLLNQSGVEGGADGYLNFFSNGTRSYSAVEIISQLAWGLGYCGMPHILTRFMAIRNEKELKKSRVIAIIWVVISLGAACVIGVFGRAYLYPTLLGTDGAASTENVFIEMIIKIFTQDLALPFIGGLFLCGILAAIMSTADSQLLVASSSFSSDIYNTLFNKNASEKTLLNVSRITILVVAIIACLLALDPNSSVFEIVAHAWAGFGAAFGPVILYSLFWKRCNEYGALAGVISGGAVALLWAYVPTAIWGADNLPGIFTVYEIIPGFIVSLALIFIVSLATKAPSKEVIEEFESVKTADV